MELLSSGAEPIIDLVDILVPGRKGNLVARLPESRRDSPSSDEKERPASEPCSEQEVLSASEPVESQPDFWEQALPDSPVSVSLPSEKPVAETSESDSFRTGEIQEQRTTVPLSARSSVSEGQPDVSSLAVQDSQETAGVPSSIEDTEAPVQETAVEGGQTLCAGLAPSELPPFSVEEREPLEARREALEARIVQLEQDVQDLAERVITLEAQLLASAVVGVQAEGASLLEQPVAVEEAEGAVPETGSGTCNSFASDEKTRLGATGEGSVSSVALSYPESFETTLSRPFLEEKTPRNTERSATAQTVTVGKTTLPSTENAVDEPYEASAKECFVSGNPEDFFIRPVLDPPSLPSHAMIDKEAFDALTQRVLALEARTFPNVLELEERILHRIREELESFTVEQSASLSKILSEMRRRIRMLEVRPAQTKTETPDSATLAGEVLELIDKTLTVKVAEAAARVVREEVAALTSEQV